MQRTYSRKGAKRNSHGSGDLHASVEPSNSAQLRKRRKIQVEIVSSESDSELGVGTITHTSAPPSTHRSRSSMGNGSSSKSATIVTPLSASRRPAKPPSKVDQTAVPVKRIGTASSVPMPSTGVLSPEKTAKDLSSLFPFSESTKAPTSKPSSGGIAKRMLRRAKTDSTLTETSPTKSSSMLDGPTIAGPSTPRKLISSMTEPIIGTINASPSSPSRTPGKSKSRDDISSPAARPSLVATNNIRTYGGKSRSFLVAMPAASTSAMSLLDSQSQSQDSFLQGSTQEDEFEIRESYTELRARWGVDASEDDPWPPPASTVTPEASPSKQGKGKGKGKQVLPPAPVLPPNMMNDLKSISELRSRGETRRFLDEVGYLFEGLDPTGAVGVRRGSALEVVTKLCDSEFARKAKAADFLGRAWEALRGAGAGDGDKVLDTILAFFSALAARDPRDLSELAAKSDFISVLFEQLESLHRKNDPLWLISCGMSDAELKRAGISKTEKANLTSLHTMVRKRSAIFENVDFVSHRLLVSHALATLSPSMYTASHLPALLQSLFAELQSLSSRISAYTSGLSLFPPLTSNSCAFIPSLLHVDSCLRLLDSFLLGRWSADDDDESSKDLQSLKIRALSDGLLTLCVVADIESRDSEQKDARPIAFACLESLFRVLVNLTHENPPWCEVILNDYMAILSILRITVTSHREYISLKSRNVKKASNPESHSDAQGDVSAQSLDRLCLSLGLLTNLVQACDKAKDVLHEIDIDPQCQGKRSCISSCRCPDHFTAIQCLVQIYTDYDKSEDSIESMIRGHIAILLGLLIQDHVENEKLVLSALPGTLDSDKEKLVGLVENAREFAAFYAEFAKKVSDVAAINGDESGDEDEDGARGSSMSRMLKESQGESVARDVIRYLEKLRDRASD